MVGRYAQPGSPGLETCWPRSTRWGAKPTPERELASAGDRPWPGEEGAAPILESRSREAPVRLETHRILARGLRDSGGLSRGTKSAGPRRTGVRLLKPGNLTTQSVEGGGRSRRLFPRQREKGDPAPAVVGNRRREEARTHTLEEGSARRFPRSRVKRKFPDRIEAKGRLRKAGPANPLLARPAKPSRPSSEKLVPASGGARRARFPPIPPPTRSPPRAGCAPPPRFAARAKAPPLGRAPRPPRLYGLAQSLVRR